MKKLLLSLFCIIAASLAANAADPVASVPCAATSWNATQNYTSTVSSTDNNWKTTNFHNNQAKTWDHIRCGAKKSGKSDPDVTSTAYIVSATKFSPVGSIKLTYNLTNKASGSFDSMKIYASETTSFTADNLIKEEKDITLLTTAATKEYTIPVQTTAKYYKVEFTVTNTSTTNGVLSVSGLEFYAPEVVEGPQDFNPGFEANYTLEEETSFNLAANWPANAPEVKYTLSDEDYFYIENNIIEALYAGGPVTVNYSWDATEDWNAGEGSFTVNVIKPIKYEPVDITFDFTENNYGLITKVGNDSTYDNEVNSISTENEDGITLKIDFNGNHRHYQQQDKDTQELLGKDLRIAKNASFTLSCPEDSKITKITFTKGNSSTFKFSSDKGTLEGNQFPYTWTGEEGFSSIKFTNADTGVSAIGTIVVTVLVPERPVVAEPEIEFGVVKNEDESIAHHTVAINNADDDATYEAYINYEDGLQGETKLEFDATTGLFAPIKIYETPLHYQNHKVIQPAHIYNVTVFASKTGATTKSTTKQFITVPRISKVEEEPATRTTDKDITVTMHVSDPRVNMFYSIDGATAQTYTEKQKITVPANATITAWAESKDGSLKSEVQKLTNDGVFSGVEEIEAADADAKWYDLQGRAVNAERLAPGIYVKVNGKKAVKVVVK